MARSDDGELDWWKRWPSLRDAEMAAFAAQGATVRSLHEAHGLLIVEVDWPRDPESVRLRVGYSPQHPFCRPTVTAPGLRLSRHQHPFEDGLCLLTQEAGQWLPYQKVADLIAEQLPKIFQVNAHRDAGAWDEASALEETAPDPLSRYYADLSEPTSSVFFSDPTTIPAASCGHADFLITGRGIVDDVERFEAVLNQVRPISGTWLAQPFSPKWASGFKHVAGRWVRLQRPIPSRPEDIVAAAEAEIARQATVNRSYAPLQQMAKNAFTLTAIVFEDEATYGEGGMGDGWLFLTSRRSHKGAKPQISLVRGFGLSDDLFVRVPVAAELRSKTILLVGCGAIGSFAATEFARAGIGKLMVLDHDVVEPGNSVRWPLGRPAWGLKKASALANFIHHHYPTTTAYSCNGRIGEASTDFEGAPKLKEHPVRVLRELIDSADLVVDASASTECQGAIADLCYTAGKPLVIAYATEGVAGGVVARIRANLPACWVCLNERWHDGSIPLPPVNPAGKVLPIGCNAPTFTGGSFDLQEVSLELVRSAIGLLAPEVYDPGDWDWSIFAHTDKGRRCLPQWQSGTLHPHENCTRCVSK
jgi:hypothetical protein